MAKYWYARKSSFSLFCTFFDLNISCLLILAYLNGVNTIRHCTSSLRPNQEAVEIHNAILRQLVNLAWSFLKSSDVNQGGIVAAFDLDLVAVSSV